MIWFALIPAPFMLGYAGLVLAFLEFPTWLKKS